VLDSDREAFRSKGVISSAAMVTRDLAGLVAAAEVDARGEELESRRDILARSELFCAAQISTDICARVRSTCGLEYDFERNLAESRCDDVT
jgi:hypothetical protein